MPEKMVQYHVYREYLQLKQAGILVNLDRFDEANRSSALVDKCGDRGNDITL